VPTTYPKSPPTEMLGLLVLLKDHHGAEDLARLADDLDLEIDEILPSSDWAEALELVRVEDGRVTFTETGRRLVEATIRERKNILREQLLRTTLFATLARALDTAPGGRMSEEDVNQLIALTTAPADEAELNIINWGRYAELFRYDPDERQFTIIRHRIARPPSTGRTPPAAPPSTAPSPSGAVPSTGGGSDRSMRTAVVGT
jgi:hypothetical protein